MISDVGVMDHQVLTRCWSQAMNPRTGRRSCVCLACLVVLGHLPVVQAGETGTVRTNTAQCCTTELIA